MPDRAHFIEMDRALVDGLKSPPMIPAVRVCGHIFSHLSGHDMAMNFALNEHGEAAEAEFEANPDGCFGYVYATKASQP